jgi:hypothetical protein
MGPIPVPETGLQRYGFFVHLQKNLLILKIFPYLCVDYNQIGFERYGRPFDKTSR